jgi:hypothetical protein
MREDTTMGAKVAITNRIKPCACGCTGRDPWHAPSFERVVENVTEESGTCLVTAYSEPQTYRQVGWAKFPWSNDPVKVVRVVLAGNGREHNLGWHIAREN